jgi:hypothetical protein
MYRARYCLAGVIGNGPITATRSPAAGRHCALAIMKSQTLPNDSTTVLEESDFAASAAARVKYEYRCQNTGSSGNLSIG